MNSLRYGTCAIGAPYSQARFEALCEDIRNVDPSTKAWQEYAEEIGKDYDGMDCYVNTDGRRWWIRAKYGTLVIEEF